MTATKERGTTVRLHAGELLDAVSDVMRVVQSRPTRPALSCVLIGHGKVSATNLETRIDRTIGADCEPMLLPAERLAAILRTCRSDDAVVITKAGTSCTVKAGRGSWTLPTEDVAEFPSWDHAEMKPVCRLPADQFTRAVRAVSYAVDNDSSRYALGAVCIDVSNGNPTFVATDGRRLATAQTETDQAVDDSCTLVPAIAIRIAATLAENSDGAVQIEAGPAEVVFSCDTATVSSRLVEGKFPRWRDVFPEGGAEPAVLERSELLAATRAAAVVTSEQSLGVDYTFSADTLTLSARSSEYGESRVKCATISTGGASAVKLNPVFVREFLSWLPADEEPNVEIVTHGESGAVVFACGDYRSVIMPLCKE